MGQHLEQAGEQVGADVADLRDRRHRQLAALDDLVRQAHALCGTRNIQLVGNVGESQNQLVTEIVGPAFKGNCSPSQHGILSEIPVL